MMANTSQETNSLSTGACNKDETEASKTKVVAKKKKTLTSAVWDDFDRLVTENEVIATCKHCKKKCNGSSANGTSHLKNHLKRCKKKPRTNVFQKLVTMLENGGVGKVETFKVDAERSRVDLAHMIILHKLPFAFADYVGFRKFVGNLQPLFTVKGSKTVASDCMKVYELEKTNMYREIEKVQGRISVTSDMWTSCKGDGYMSLTAHYIDEDWKLQKRLLNYLKVDVPHNAETLYEALKVCLMEWNIDRKRFALTLDNCSVNDSMANKLNKDLNEKGFLLSDGALFHVRCAAHILNIVVKEGLLKINGVLEKIRESVRYVKNSPKKQGLFDEAVKHLYINCSKRLVRDCKTRWNSTFEMLEVVLVYKDAFSRLRDYNREYKLCPSEIEWEMARGFADCLRIFRDSTKKFSGSNYTSSNIFLREVCEIHHEILQWTTSRNEFIRDMAIAMKVKFDKYWETCHSVLAIASILDPQLKMQAIQYLYGLIYGSFEASYEIQKIESAFRSLYDEYEMNLSLIPSTPFEVGTSGVNEYPKESGSQIVSGFDKFVHESLKAQTTKKDIDYYLEESILPRSSKFEILSWWKVNGAKYPVLSQMARDILGIQVSTVPFESAFSTGGRVLDKYRSSLDPETVQALLCTQNWLQNQCNRNVVTTTLSHSASSLGSNEVIMVDREFE